MGNIVAVKDDNVEIKDKEFVILVGPFGCEKSTIRRMIAGLEENTEGSRYIDGALVNNIQPNDRDIAMAFRKYALYSHMMVYYNMAIGLKIRKISRDEIRRRALEAAEILEN